MKSCAAPLCHWRLSICQTHHLWRFLMDRTACHWCLAQRTWRVWAGNLIHYASWPVLFKMNWMQSRRVCFTGLLISKRYTSYGFSNWEFAWQRVSLLAVALSCWCSFSAHMNVWQAVLKNGMTIGSLKDQFAEDRICFVKFFFVVLFVCWWRFMSSCGLLFSLVLCVCRPSLSTTWQLLSWPSSPWSRLWDRKGQQRRWSQSLPCRLCWSNPWMRRWTVALSLVWTFPERYRQKPYSSLSPESQIRVWVALGGRTAQLELFQYQTCFRIIFLASMWLAIDYSNWYVVSFRCVVKEWLWWNRRRFCQSLTQGERCKRKLVFSAWRSRWNP